MRVYAPATGYSARMNRLRHTAVAIVLLALVTAVMGCAAPPASAPAAERSSRYEDLTRLFGEWRIFQQPRRTNGVPDYSAAAMATQQRDLAGQVARLAAIDPSAWPIPQQADYHLVRAEMNGLDFDHRVLKPWANNPAFYVTVFLDESDQPAREGPFAAGAVEVWQHAFPLSAASAADLKAGLQVVPALLDQVRSNLTGNQRDIWTYGAMAIRAQSADLATFASRLTDGPQELKDAVERAREATDTLAAWLDDQTPTKTGPSGIGEENYDWYLRNVMLMPYTWHDEVALMERELARSVASLAFEEHRNAGLPPQLPIATAAEFDRRSSAAITEYMAFLKDRNLLTIRPDMDPRLRERVGRFNPGPREFFGEVDARDPMVMRTHGYHWFDKGWLAHVGHPSPMRQGALLYNIFITRTEGHATAWEELMLQAGMFDARPRSRELIYILLAERAARALGDLKMHSNEFTLEQASQYASDHTPRGWLSMDGNLVRGEQHLYLQQPGYGTSYVIGKLEIDKLIAERRRQLGDRFTLRQFMDEFNAAGFVPASLLRWELTGALPDDVRRMLEF